MAALFAVALWAEAPARAGELHVEISTERAEVALGDPILVNVLYRNEGKETREISECHTLRFHTAAFDVRDSEGRKVPNPYADIETPNFDGKCTIHKMAPGGAVTFRAYVNECAAFDKPGEYSVAHVGCPDRPLKIRILPAPDRKARVATIDDLMALWRNPSLREREAYARYRPYITEANGATDALRLLAFRREQDLLPFWIERLADRSRRFDSGFELEALAGFPDQAAVLKALEERLARAVDDRVLDAYVLLAVPSSDENAFARRKQLRERYEGK